MRGSVEIFLKDTVAKNSLILKTTTDVWGNYTQTKDVPIINEVRFYDHHGYSENDQKYTVQETPAVSVRERHFVDNLNYQNEETLLSYIKTVTRENPKAE